MRNSPISLFSPVAGSRVNATPVPELLFKLPNTIGITLTAVPHEYGISLSRRYTFARGLSHERKTASIASLSCSTGSDGKSSPSCFLYSALNCSARSLRSAAVKSTSYLTPFSSFILSMSCSKYFLPTSITTSENIWMNLLYESYTKRSKAGSELPAIIAATTSSLRPRLRIVSIIPGIEALAPERTDTRSGFV